MILGASAALFAQIAAAQNFVRMEVRVIDSITLSGEYEATAKAIKEFLVAKFRLPAP